jgi:uncharacterized protein with FMN-binding domain
MATLADELARLKVPPDWFATMPVAWDTARPWKDARLEVRRLLALEGNGPQQGMKLTWLYAQKGDIGDGHELPMYLFMSGNYAWAAREYPKYLQTVKGKGATHGYVSYASCLAHFGEMQQALTVLGQAMNDLPPEPWRIPNTAKIHEDYGDLYAKMGDAAKARQSYQEAIRIYPTSQQPYGRHLIPRQVAKIQAKLDLLTMKSLDLAALRPGTYTGKTMAYAETPEMEVTVGLQGGRITDVKVRHSEKIELGATKIIPQRIVEKQSLQVDGVTGATVTSQAIVQGALRALKQAGLK